MVMASKVFSSIPPLFSKLARVLSGDMDCSELALKSHSIDGSPFGVRPQAVLYPKTTTDIKHAIAFAREYQIPLTVCGGGTAASGGSLGEGIIIDMTRYFSQIRHVNMMEHTVTVDAGVRIDDLKERLAAWNMELPPLEQEYSRASVGGLVATKSATSGTFHVGTIREWVEGVTVVVDSGEEHHIEDGVTPSGRLLGIYQSVFPLLLEQSPTLRAARREMSDDATGYSVWNTSIGPRQLLDQLVGSEGTLGIITSVKLRVVPKKKHTASILVPVAALGLLRTYADVARHHRAEKLFFFDETFRRLADMFHPSLVPPLPEQTPYALVVTFKHDTSETLRGVIQTFLRALVKTDSEWCELDEQTASKLMSYAFLASLVHDYFKGTHIASTSTNGIIVPLRTYTECLAELDAEAGKTGRLYMATGYVGSGHMAMTTCFDTQSSSYEQDLQEYRERMFSIVEHYHGGISAVGGDGLERTASLPSVYNEATRAIFKQIKEVWDPLSIFNPSKKISISKDYLIKHTVRSLE